MKIIQSVALVVASGLLISASSDHPNETKAKASILDPINLEYVNANVIIKRYPKDQLIRTSYYKAFDLFESGQHGIHNPLYFSSKRGVDGKSHVYRATNLYVSLYGSERWYDQDIVSGFEVAPKGGVAKKGMVEMANLGGDVSVNLPAVYFYETNPLTNGRLVTKEEKGSQSDNDRTLEKKLPRPRPDIPDELKNSIKLGNVIHQNMFNWKWGVYRIIYSYDDFMYFSIGSKRYRVVYTLDPIDWQPGYVATKQFYAFDVRGGYLHSFGSNVAIENSAPPSRPLMQKAVVAFNDRQCPPGWEEYKPAYGRFIRGIDPTGREDMKRDIGSYQKDAFQGHTFGDGANKRLRYMPKRTDNSPPNGHSNMHSTGIYGQNEVYGTTVDATIASDGRNGVPRVSNETRPKNVALLYCQKVGD